MVQGLERISTRNIYRIAIEAYHHDVNVVPIPGNGSKHPPMKWEQYQKRRVTQVELKQWFLFSAYPGLAYITGGVSSGLELLDFDDREIYRAWQDRMEQEGFAESGRARGRWLPGANSQRDPSLVSLPHHRGEPATCPYS